MLALRITASCALLALGCLQPAWGQGGPLSDDSAAPPTASTAAVVPPSASTASTTTVQPPAASTAAAAPPSAPPAEDGTQASAPQAPAAEGGAPQRRPSALIPPAAARWKPFPTRKAAEADIPAAAFTSHIRRIRVQQAAAPPPTDVQPPAPAPPPQYAYRGRRSDVTARARSYRAGPGRLLIVSVYPDALRSRRMHLEVRYRVAGGELKSAELAAVRIREGAPSSHDDSEDSMTLRAKGVEFDEDVPAGGQIYVAHLDAVPGGEQAFNAARVWLADFAVRELGKANFSYAVQGVSGKRDPPPGKKASPKPRRAPKPPVR